MYAAKTKALISFAVTAKLICVFIFTYPKSQFSDNEAHICNINRPDKARFVFIIWFLGKPTLLFQKFQ